uniref:CSON005415 protein n=1 Tax=Culicoides sonorensis TaxID=179676 RepID=A0A336N305_CULSO
MNGHALLSDADVFKVIKNALKTSVIEIKSWTLKEKDGEPTGFLGEYLILEIEALIDQNAVKLNFFVKSLPSSSQIKEFVKGINLFHKEATVYSQLLSPMISATDLRFSANSYFSRDDVIIFENLSLQNFHLMPPEMKFNQKHVRTILNSLAQLHASSIVYEQNVLSKPFDEVYGDVLFEVSFCKTNKWFVTGMKSIVMIALKRSKYSKNPEMCALINEKFMQGLETIYELVREIPPKFKKVLCHRDIWRNNLMFKFDIKNGNEIDYSSPIECALVDFQLARYLPPAEDILMTLYVLQRKHDREMAFSDNLNYYYDLLGKYLRKFDLNVNEILPFNELLDSCEHFKLVGLLIKAIYLQTAQLPLGEMEKMREDDEKYQNYITNDRPELLNYIDTDEDFREWMVEAVDELIDYILIEKK